MRFFLLLTAMLATAAHADNFKVTQLHYTSANGQFANVVYLTVTNMTTDRGTVIAVRCVGKVWETRESANNMPGVVSGGVDFTKVALAGEPSEFDTAEHCVEGILKLNQAVDVGFVYDPESIPMLMSGNLKSEKAVKRSSDISEKLGGYYYNLKIHPEMWTWGED